MNDASFKRCESMICALTHSITGQFYCTFCKNMGVFVPYKGRQNAICPKCNSSERHRLLSLEIDNLSQNDLILCITEDKLVASYLSKYNVYYVDDSDLDQLISLQQMNKKYDAIICDRLINNVTNKNLLMKVLESLLTNSGRLIVGGFLNGNKDGLSDQLYYIDQVCELNDSILLESLIDTNLVLSNDYGYV